MGISQAGRRSVVCVARKFLLVVGYRTVFLLLGECACWIDKMMIEVDCTVAAKRKGPEFSLGALCVISFDIFQIVRDEEP